MILNILLALSLSHECPMSYDSLLKKDVYTFVDNMPEYNGGQRAMLKFITQKYKAPGSERFSSIYVEIVIETDGSVAGERIQNKKKDEYTASEIEMLRVFRSMPNWKHGKCDGKSVTVRTVVPIQF